MTPVWFGLTGGTLSGVSGSDSLDTYQSWERSGASESREVRWLGSSSLRGESPAALSRVRLPEG